METVTILCFIHNYSQDPYFTIFNSSDLKKNKKKPACNNSYQLASYFGFGVGINQSSHCPTCNCELLLIRILESLTYASTWYFANFFSSFWLGRTLK